MSPVGDLDAALGQQSSIQVLTRGRHSGAPHRVLVWFACHDGSLYFLAHARAHGRGTDWYRNLVADHRATVEWSGHRIEIVPEPLPAGVDVFELFRAKYGTAAVAQWYQDTARIPVRARIR